MSRIGPTNLGYACHGCVHYEQKRYRVQGDTGYDKFCRHSGQPKPMEEFGDTPEWCPILMLTKRVDLTGDDLSVASDLRVRLNANYDGTIESLQAQHIALVDKLLARKP